MKALCFCCLLQKYAGSVDLHALSFFSAIGKHFTFRESIAILGIISSLNVVGLFFM
jgi:hypothetical protein